eukprot:PLAT6444.1.p1 GENE.PLAT6444.1~~PLAT6444.1.p1  ORF type:complete len:1082 (+),score=436.89 PLAT6444.1:90-3248(+)
MDDFYGRSSADRGDTHSTAEFAAGDGLLPDLATQDDLLKQRRQLRLGLRSLRPQMLRQSSGSIRDMLGKAEAAAAAAAAAATAVSATVRAPSRSGGRSAGLVKLASIRGSALDVARHRLQVLLSGKERAARERKKLEDEAAAAAAAEEAAAAAAAAASGSLAGLIAMPRRRAGLVLPGPDEALLKMSKYIRPLSAHSSSSGGSGGSAMSGGGMSGSGSRSSFASPPVRRLRKRAKLRSSTSAPALPASADGSPPRPHTTDRPAAAASAERSKAGRAKRGKHGRLAPLERGERPATTGDAPGSRFQRRRHAMRRRNRKYNRGARGSAADGASKSSKSIPRPRVAGKGALASSASATAITGAAGERDETGCVAGTVYNDRTVFPSWLQKDRDFQSLFPRFAPSMLEATHAMLQVATRKAPEERSDDDVLALVSLCEKYPILGTLDLPKRKLVCRQLQLKSYHKGQMVFAQGDPGTAFYIIYSGSVDVVINGETVVALEAGTSFGELALTSDKGRAASIVCRERTDLLVLAAHYYKEVLRRHQDSLTSSNIRFLNNLGLFTSWTTSMLRVMAKVMVERRLAAGELLIKQDTAVEALYFIKKGIITVVREVEYKASNSWPAGRRRGQRSVAALRKVCDLQLKHMVAGEWLGEELFRGLQRHPYSARVSEDAVVLVLTKMDSHRLLLGSTRELLVRHHELFRPEAELRRAYDTKLKLLRGYDSLKREALGKRYRARATVQTRTADVELKAAAISRKEVLDHSRERPVTLEALRARSERAKRAAAAGRRPLSILSPPDAAAGAGAGAGVGVGAAAAAGATGVGIVGLHTPAAAAVAAAADATASERTRRHVEIVYEPADKDEVCSDASSDLGAEWPAPADITLPERDIEAEVHAELEAEELRRRRWAATGITATTVAEKESALRMSLHKLVKDSGSGDSRPQHGVTGGKAAAATAADVAAGELSADELDEAELEAIAAELEAEEEEEMARVAATGLVEVRRSEEQLTEELDMLRRQVGGARLPGVDGRGDGGGETPAYAKWLSAEAAATLHSLHGAHE